MRPYPPLEVIQWHEGRGIFMTCFVGGSECHPEDETVFKYEGGEFVRKSTRLYWIDMKMRLEDIAYDHAPTWCTPPKVSSN